MIRVDCLDSLLYYQFYYVNSFNIFIMLHICNELTSVNENFHSIDKEIERSLSDLPEKVDIHRKNMLVGHLELTTP